MFIKPLKIPCHILKTMALDRRIPVSHPHKEFITQRASNLYSGYKGEKALEYYLNFLPEDQFFIFHYLRLPDKYGHFQMDFLILSMYFHLIIEVKNFYDNISFDEFGQSFRIKAEEVQVFNNPVEQVSLQHNRFVDWNRCNDFPAVPVEKVVIYSRDDIYLRNLTNNKLITDLVMHRDKLLPKIQLFMGKHKTLRLTEKQLMEMSYKLLEQHTPEKFLLIDQLGITADQLVKGVECPECGNIPMKWSVGQWECFYCGKVSKTAHRLALADYALLNQKYINNRQAREFLQVNSVHSMRRLFHREKFSHVGVSSGRKYELSVEKLLDE
ncbi:nuclease-related domain-containing protein [Virgibacillus ihumii]|uniref:nuclease-related domain-containing protein n=1 Tax=Virgibacillus ihumii TaxID=2686091 RepID=UPI00157C0DBE|nr:nuclease-related domain-containing protein [Virgibacillus ihumii]